MLRYDPVSTGAPFLPFCAGMAAATMASSSLVERFGSRAVLTVGLTVGAVGMLCSGRLDVGSAFGAFLLASIPASMGIGLCIAPTLSLGTSAFVLTGLLLLVAAAVAVIFVPREAAAAR